MSTPVELVLSALSLLNATQPRPSGEGWAARCPAHEDRKPSLMITEGRDGRCVLYCHAGCSVEAICAALGLAVADLFPPRDQQDERPRIIATYAYENEHGDVLLEVCRRSDKQFPQRTPDGHGGWKWGLNGARRVLYHLPQLLAAIQRGEPIYIAEGEKDVHTLEQAGAIATTNPGGAGKWRDEYTQHLRGASHVTIIADRDEPGIAHAKRIAQSLAEAGIPHQVVHAIAGKDASDHLAAGHTLDELRPLQQGDPQPDPAFRLRTMTAREIADLPEPPQADQILGGLLVRSQRLVIGGHTGEGKTTLTLQLLKAACSGEATLGFEAQAPHRALIIDAEQGLATIRRRVLEAGLADTDVTFAIQPDGLELDQEAEHINAVEDQLETGRYDIVVADPLYKLHRGESNDERAAVDLMRRFDAWRDRYGFCLVMPVHARKTQPGQPTRLTIHELFGSSAYTRGAEIVLGISRVRDGYGRLYWLKDRDGTLPAGVGTTWGLLYDHENGYRRDPSEQHDRQTVVDKVLYLLASAGSHGMTVQALVDAKAGSNRSVRAALKKVGAEETHLPHGEKLYKLPPDAPDDQETELWSQE